MDEEMNLGELLKETAEENQTRKILEIVNQCETLEEAKRKTKQINQVKVRKIGRASCRERV